MGTPKTTALNKTAQYVWDRATGKYTAIESGELAVIVAENSVDSDILYVGKAVIGTATSASTWQIQELDLNTFVVQKTWADGDNNFDNVFDNRESLSYS